MLESLVGNLGLVQIQVFQFFQSRKMLEAGIGNLGSFQVKPPQRRKALQVSKSGTGYFGIPQVQGHDVTQSFQGFESFIRKQVSPRR